MNEWISVDDRKPEPGEVVLTMFNDIYELQEYVDSSAEDGYHYWEMHDPTYWMRIPETPSPSLRKGEPE